MIYRCLRQDRKAGVAAFALIGVLVALGTVGFVVVMSNDFIDVEARIHDTDWSKDPIRTQLDVRITNKQAPDLVVERFVVTVWADEARSVALSSGTIEAFPVPGNTQRTVALALEVHNADAFGGKVWVDVDATWTHGDQHHHEEIKGKEISVGAALSQLF
jgi:hypothetical protein